MTIEHAVLAFTLAAGLLTITPGLDTALVLHTAAVEGSRRAMLAGMGICTGVLVWGLAAATGLSALLALSRLAFDILRMVGAGYLLYLGARLLFRRRSVTDECISTTNEGSRANWFVRGFLTNILNPKVGVFYLSFLPQFIPSGVRVLPFSMLLAFIHAAEGILWFLLLSYSTDFLSRWLWRPGVATALDRATGVVFVGFGLKLALDRGR